ncbi:MAG: AsmA family protein, partial [Acetobacteraceae bacterium]|nr:AsmA family protein [Acetobacteraceae bacterium]
MRAGRFILLGVAGLLLVLVAGIWVVPGMLDWNRYRVSIAALVASGLGRPVRIGGNVTLHLLPQPILTASGIEVDDAGHGVVLAAHELRLRVALGPLLGGRVDARELELRGADLRLPWPPPAGALAQRPPAWLTGLQARVEESRLQVGNLVVSDIGASLATDPDTGTLSAVGSGTSFGRTWRFTARLARPGRDGAAGLDLSLDGQGKLQDTGATFSGVLGADGALSGRVAGRGPDLSQLMPGPAVPWRGDGRLSASGGLAVADELALEIGGSPARGAVALRVQPDARLDLALAAGRLDLDAWIPVLMRSAQTGAPPPTLPTGIDLSAEAATLAGGTLRRLRGAFDVDADGVSAREVSAVLPGDAQITLSGRMPGKGRGTMFEGTAHVAAPDFRTTLRWLEPFAPAVLGSVPARALRTADLNAKLTIDGAGAALSDISGTLDAAGLQGGLALRIGSRPGVSAGFTLDRIVLDPWLPEPARLRDPARAYADFASALGHAGFDADIKLQAQKASWRGAELGPLSIDGQSEAGRLTLRRLELTGFGIRATASGTLGEGARLSEGRVELSTQDVSPVRGLLPPDWTAGVGLLRGPANMLVQMSGPTDALAVRTTLDMADLRVEAQPVLNLPARRWAGSLTLHHPGAPRLLEVLGLPGTASWLGDGSFSLIAQASGAPDRVELSDFTLVAGSNRATGQLALRDRTLSGRVAAETLALPMVYARSPDPLPLGFLDRWQANLRVQASEVLVGLEPVVHSLQADLSLADGVLSLPRIAAKVAGGDVSGAIRLELADTPRLSLAGEARGVPI